MKLFLKVLIISVIALVLAVPALAQQSGEVVNASRVNLRSGPGVGFPVVTILGRGQQITVISANADASWLQVCLLNGTAGWVNARYIGIYGDQGGGIPVTQPTGRNNGVVNTPLLNVRGGPGANFNVVGKLSQHTAVNLLGRNADSSWAHITIPNIITGWVSTRYITSSVMVSGLPIVNTTGTTPGFPPPVSGSGQTGSVTAGGLNVRYGPGTYFGLFARLQAGETVSLVGRNNAGNWLLVQLANGFSGWVSANYIRTGYPLGNLPVRAG